jgi:hypothetical protein
MKVTVNRAASFSVKVGPCAFAEWPDVHVRVAGQYGPDEEVN